mgnify:CR=1 FL=1
MALYARNRLSRTGLCLITACCALGVVLPASADPVPRILLAGDSWSALMQAFDSYQTVLPEFPGCGDYRSLGFRTAIVGMRASEFVEPGMLATVAEELALHPTIDIVHLSLGGNDILYGTWRPDMTPAEQQAVFDSVTAHIETAVNFILAVRPGIRVGLCGYTFGDHEDSGITPAQSNLGILGLERTKLAMTQRKNRVYYIHNLGLMQYSYGIPKAEPPILPGAVRYPGGYPAYSPMPGGNLAYGAPEEALVDSDIHLTPAGYAIVARRCINEFYGVWLGWPRVFEVRLLAADATQAAFRVRFSESVTGVDETDFASAMQAAGKALNVGSVVGSGDTYTVTVVLDGTPGTPRLDVLDDDSIVDVNANPLGGPDAGNGLFTHNGVLAYQDPPPLSDDDFDAFLEFLQITTAPYKELLNGFSFAPDQCDANGGFGGIDPVQINGNGLLDSCEFGLIRACLRNPALDLGASGGISHAAVSAAWQNNIGQMRKNLGGTGGLALSVLRGLDSILAGYFILGDLQSSLLPPLLIFAATSYNEFPLDLTVPDTGKYVLLPQFLGLHGDADGDGSANILEYQFFMPLGGRELYLIAALDPTVKPGAQTVSHSTGGAFSQGTPFSLGIPGTLNLAGGFQWRRDGQPLQNTNTMFGTHWCELHILRLGRDDGGIYDCVDAGGQRIFGPVVVSVNPVPAVSTAGLLALGLAAAAVGARRLRKR